MGDVSQQQLQLQQQAQLAAASADAATCTDQDLATLLHPFPSCCLGWFCLGYHLSDAPGRVSAIVDLLLRSALVPASTATPQAVSQVLLRLLKERPRLISLQASPWAACAPLARQGAATSVLTLRASEWAGFSGKSTCLCGNALCRWRSAPATFLTLSRGMVLGTVVFLRCFACGRVYGGRWRWDHVEENSTFPDGFHRPRLAGERAHGSRWFYATPQVCWEVQLLEFLRGCIARGGMSLTATFEVYARLWRQSLGDTMYAQRPHFIAKLTVALLTWSAITMIEDSCVDVADFRWHLRPHHVAEDFHALVAVVRRCFDALAVSHTCSLMQTIKAFILDGKWSLQTSLCNARDVGLVWEPALGTGYFQGCTRRPVPGGRYCKDHASECTMAPEDCVIDDHRTVVAGDALALEYHVAGCWRPHSAVDIASVRAYELRLLRARSTKDRDTADTDTCNKDPRKGGCETTCGRKSNGILAAVTPCLQIAAIRPMYATESLTQVLHLVWHLLLLFPSMTYVIYDNACALVRHLTKQIATRSMGPDVVAAWQRLVALNYVIDRLRWAYHRACRDPSSSYFVQGVDPASHPALRGVDTEGAEQIFHIANRWQDVLSNSAPVHQELFLIVFAREHNRAHSCAHAVRQYDAAQRARSPLLLSTEAAPAANAAHGECCVAPRSKKKKRVHAPDGCADLVASDAPAADNASPNAQSSVGDSIVLLSVVNERSNTMHAVTLKTDVYSECSWAFQGRAVPVPQESLRGKGFWKCGICYGVRHSFD